MSPAPTVVLNDKGMTVIGNTAFSELMGVPPDQIDGLTLFDSKIAIPEKIGLKSKLKTALDQDKTFETESFLLSTPNQKQKFKIQGHTITKEKDTPYRVLLKFLTQS